MRSRSLVHSALLALTLLTTVAPRLSAQELLPPRVTDRKFPQTVYCPFPFDLTFVANGPDAILRFSTTTVNYFDTNFGDVEWSKQYLDNICVSSDADYLAHQVALGSYSSDCYISPGPHLTQTFHFQAAGAIPVKDTFDSDPSAAGWDLTHNAYWDQTTTAPNDAGTETTFTPLGALGLGAFHPPLSEADSAFTTRMVHGLTSGVTYHLTGRWSVGQMQLNKILLTIAVLGTGGTPAKPSTLGSVKLRYR